MTANEILLRWLTRELNDTEKFISPERSRELRQAVAALCRQAEQEVDQALRAKGELID